ncbi:MAG: hypothetical protein PWQ37_1195 [Candidatus Petromonas sp.]|jgi:competence protein ComGD|nr:hypothetical protein [Candidatus Petromonas sp.]
MLRNKRGFTLIEAILVLAIISIFVLIGSIELKDVFADAKLRAAARMIANDIRYAQQLAISTKSDDVEVFFNKANNSYNVNSGMVTYKSEKLPEGVKFHYNTFANDRCIYSKTGNPIHAGKVIIEHNGHYFTITVKVATGRVIIYDYKKQ